MSYIDVLLSSSQGLSKAILPEPLSPLAFILVLKTYETYPFNAFKLFDNGDNDKNGLILPQGSGTLRQ